MKTKIALLALLACLFGCRSTPKDTLTIAAAANIQYPIREVLTAFEAQTGQTTHLIIGSSGKLTAQIQQGAPYDLFLSADKKYPQSLFQNQKAIHPPRIYAKGKLALWTLGEPLRALPDLSRKNIQKIAIPNPQTAPYGREARAALKYFGIWDTLRPKIIFGANVAQTNQYLLSGNCEAAITAQSTAFSKEINQRGYWLDLPPESYSPIEQGVVITEYGAKHHPERSKRLFDFLFSPEARAIFARYGYTF
ncbi:MAG: molybdate ABC transporter substrate-binding protein [Bacteroidetes bacterium]|nr:MAG: molybdate ABC transporter substrate-binding protein [Bacteroidota bacterium]